MGAKKKLIFQIILFGVIFLIAFFGTKIVLKAIKSPNQELIETAEKLNKKCPKMIDKATRLDSVTAYDKTMNYYYSLINIEQSAQTEAMTSIKAFLNKNAQSNLDTTPQMDYYRKNKISLHYFYKNKQGTKLFEFTIKPQK